MGKKKEKYFKLFKQKAINKNSNRKESFYSLDNFIDYYRYIQILKICVNRLHSEKITLSW